MKHYPLIRTIYLYLFAMLGLILITIGSVRFLDMALKAFIFTKAEEEQRLLYKMPPMPPINIKELEKSEEDKQEICLSSKEKLYIDQWLEDYKNWKIEKSKVDPITSRRHRDASLNLAMILIGLPLYLYHWGVIKKETKNKES